METPQETIARRERIVGDFAPMTLRKAADLSARYGVCQRTIYRDIDALRRQGIRIDGERGVGYMVRIRQ